jgi:hypothetical protein
VAKPVPVHIDFFENEEDPRKRRNITKEIILQIK